MAGLSFTQSGATPSNGAMGWLGSFGYKPTQNMGSTPAASALNNAQVGPNRSVVPPQPATPAPTTPVKSTTITHPDGTSIATTYHPPEQTAGLINQSTGKSNQQVMDESSAAAKTAQGVLDASRATPQPAPTTFGGVVGTLANTSQNGSQNATQATTGLLNSPQQNEALSDQAKAIGTNYGDQIAKVSNYGHALAGSYTTGAGLAPVSQGLAGQAENTTANEVQGLQSAENAALAPIDKELQAQSQAQSGLTSAGSTANTQQQTEQSGLNAAGQLIAPQQNYPFVFDPATGTYKNAAGGGVLSADQIAANIHNGTMSPQQGLAAGSYLGGSSQAQIAASMQKLDPNYNWNTGSATAAGQAAVAGAPYSAQASNIGTAGTAEANSYNTIYNNANTQAATYSQQQSAINAVGNQALDLMQNNPEINKFALQSGNKTINQLQSQLSSPQYAAFNTAIQSLQARVAQALQAGEIPTAATGNATSIANGNLTLGALASTLKQVDTEMSSFVGTQKALADYAKSKLGSTAGGGSGGGNSDPLGIL